MIAKHRIMATSLFCLVALLALTALTVETASATVDFTTVGQGGIRVTSISGFRTFCFTVEDAFDIEVSNDCLATGQDNEYYPGGKITINATQVVEGDVPPLPGADVIIQVRLGESTTSICTLKSGGSLSPFPATFTFYSTNNCLATGEPRAGALHIYMRIQYNDGLNSYDCATDGTESSGGLYSCDTITRGFVFPRMLIHDFYLASPPAGGTPYAYGTAGNEQVTPHFVVTREYEPSTNAFSIDINTTSSSNVDSLTVATLQPETGDPPNYYASASSTIDNSYATTVASYNVEIATSRTTNVITDFTTSDVQAKVVFLDDPGPGFTCVKFDLACKRVRVTSAFEADPRIYFSTDGTTKDLGVTTNHAVYNRGETATWDFYVVNARSEQVTKSTTVRIRDNDATQVFSTTKSGANYAGTYLIETGDKATNDAIGSPYSFAVNYGDNSVSSTTSHAVSSLYFLDAHVQNNSTLTKDDFPSENNGETPAFISGEDLIHHWCHVKNVRLDTEIQTTGAVVHLDMYDDDGTLVSANTANSGSDGWTNRHQQPATPPTGQWELICSVTFNGNSGTNVQEFDVASAFTGDKLARILFWPDYPHPGLTRIWAHIEFADSKFSPDSPPIIKVGRIQYNATQGTWDMVNFVNDRMYNARNDTQSVNNSMYYWDLDAAPGNYSILVKTFIQGTSVRNQAPYQVQSSLLIDGMDSSDLTQLLVWGVVIVAAFWTGLHWVGMSAMIPFFGPIVDPWPFGFKFGLLLVLAAFCIEHIVRTGLLPNLGLANARETNSEEDRP